MISGVTLEANDYKLCCSCYNDMKIKNFVSNITFGIIGFGK